MLQRRGGGVSIDGSHGRFNDAHGIPSDMLTIGQLSRASGVETAAIRRLMRSGKLRPIEFSPNGWSLFGQDEVERVRALGAPPKKPGGRPPRPPREPAPIPTLGIADKRAPRVDRQALYPASSPAPGAMLEERAPIGRYAYPTEIALSAMKLFREGKQILDAAFSLDINPQLAARIAEDYARIDGALLFTQPMISRMNEIDGLDGTFPLKSADDVLELIESAVRALACAKCGERPRKFCRECAKGIRREGREASAAAPAEGGEPGA